MRLFHIDPPGCHHATEIMQGIKAVYQLEQEFFPYLTVEFLPHRDEPAGIILLTRKGESIRKNYDFTDPEHLRELREIIWYYLHRDYDIKSLPTDKNGNLLRFQWEPTAEVIQGWQEKKRSVNQSKCCRLMAELTAQEIMNQLVTQHNIKHWWFRDSNKDQQTQKTCKQVRYQECGDNYAPNGAQYRRCIDEVTWLCNRGYGNSGKSDGNPEWNLKNKQIQEIQRKVWEQLLNKDMHVDKKLFDEVMSAGLFADVGNRMRNKAVNYKNVYNAVLQSIPSNRGLTMEGFGESSVNDRLPIIAAVVGILLVFAYIMWSKKEKADEQVMMGGFLN